MPQIYNPDLYHSNIV